MMFGCFLGGCFIVPNSMALLRHGELSPLWRHLVTVENALLVNVLSAALVAVCIGYVVRKVTQSLTVVRERELRTNTPAGQDLRFVPFAVALAFLFVPSFANNLTSLSPFYPSLVPSALSAALAASLNSRGRLTEQFKNDDGEPIRDPRRLIWLRIFLAGALAAVGLREGTAGLVATPLLLAILWLPFVRRGCSVTQVSAVWIVGFLTALCVEPTVLDGCSWETLKPHKLAWGGWLVFLGAGAVPAVLAVRLGENRWLVRGWSILLLALAITAGITGRFKTESASERFVRRVVADIGTRPFILGDGIFDSMVDAFAPAGVRRIGHSTVEEKEFLLNLVDEEPYVTNKVLVVKTYYDFKDEDFLTALEEAGRIRRDPAKAKLALGKGAVKQKDLFGQDTQGAGGADTNRLAQQRREAFRAKAEPLAKALRTMSEGYKDLPERQRGIEAAKAQAAIRQSWHEGFSGTKLSNALLTIDLQRADRKALESDAVTALTVDRNDPVANSVLGSLRLEEGKMQAAEKYLRRGVKGGGALAMSRLAMLLVNTDRAKEAEEWARKAVKLMPDDWSIRQPLAAALLEGGNFDEAAKELNEVERLAIDAKQIQRVAPFLSGARRRLHELRGKQAK